MGLSLGVLPGDQVTDMFHTKLLSSPQLLLSYIKTPPNFLIFR